MKFKKEYIIGIVVVILIVLAVGAEILIKDKQENYGEFRILSIKPDANLTTSSLPLVTYLAVITGGDSSESICYYSNTQPTSWVPFHENQDSIHTQSFMFPYTGKKKIDIKCVSENNDVVTDKAEFWVNQE